MATFLPAQDKKGRTIVYDTPEKMHRVLNYIIKEEKTRPHLMGGVLLNDLNNAYEEMMLTKKLYGKTDGRMVMHYYQSFPPGEVTPEKAKEIAEQMVQHKKFEGFQVAYATHIDRGHIHTHFIVNTVNMMDGHKWQLPSLKILQDYSDELCREHGLSVIDRDKAKVHKSQAQKDAELKGRGWKKETQFAVDEAMKVAINKADFISIMNAQGYSVKWNSNKYITFINTEGKKMRNRLFENVENYTKEALEKKFEENRLKQEVRQEEFVESKEENQSEKQQGKSVETNISESPEEKTEMQHESDTSDSLDDMEEEKEGFSHIRRETFYAVRDAKNAATSKEEFISILNSQGYNVRWDDHKYITFQMPGHQAVRNRNFYPKEVYTKEALLEKFEKNKAKLETIKSGKYREQEMHEGEKERCDILFLLSHLFSNNNSQYPHQDRIREDSMAAIEDWQREREKGKGMDWEQ